MKNSVSLLFACLLLIMFNLGAQAQTRTIERPAFETWNSTTLEIDKIAISDTATVLYIDAFYMPKNWIRIDKETYIRENGKTEKLVIKGSEGIDLSTEFFMPESGQASFKLIFPPIDKNTTKIDFIETDCNECFKIWGIHLDGKKPLPLNLPKEATAINTNKPLPIPQIKGDNASVSGQIFGNIPAEIFAQGMAVYSSNHITGIRGEQLVPINKDGTFNFSVHLAYVGSIFIDSPFYRGGIYVVPGEETKVFIDMQEKSRLESRYQKDSGGTRQAVYIINSLNLSGSDLAKNDNFYMLLNREKTLKGAYNMNPEDYKAYIINKMNETISAIQSDPAASDRIKTILTYNIKNYALSDLISYPEKMKISYVINNNLSYRDIDKIDYKPQEPDKSYYAFLKDFDLNNPMYLYTAFPGIVSQIRQLEVYGIPKEITSPMADWMTQAKGALKEDIGSNTGIFYDMLAASEYAKRINDMKPLNEKEIAEMQQIFVNKGIIDEFLVENNKAIRLIAENAKKQDLQSMKRPMYRKIRY